MLLWKWCNGNWLIREKEREDRMAGLIFNYLKKYIFFCFYLLYFIAFLREEAYHCLSPFLLFLNIFLNLFLVLNFFFASPWGLKKLQFFCLFQNVSKIISFHFPNPQIIHTFFPSCSRLCIGIILYSPRGQPSCFEIESTLKPQS